MAQILVIAFVVGTIFGLTEARLPKFMNEVCYADDPKIELCLLRNARAYLDEFTDGVPDFNIPKLDPAFLKEITIRSPGFNLTFSGAKLYGLKKTHFNKVSFDLEKRKVFLNFDVDVVLKSPYDVVGLISIVRIEGKGQAKIDVKANVDITIDYGQRKGIWKIIDRDFSYNVSYAHFDLTNLFNGKNDLLATTALTFLNQSWNLVMTDIAPPCITQIVDAIIVSINRLFLQTSPEELFHIPKGFKY